MENIVKNRAELEKLYYDKYIDMEYDNSISIYDVDTLTYQLLLDEGWIIEHRASGSAACGCDYCYYDSSEVVAWIEGCEPYDCQE